MLDATRGLLVLDCDGVIVDSEPIAVRIDAQVLAHLGWPLTEAEIVERFVGRSHASMVHDIEAHLGHPLDDGWDDAFQHLYRQAFEAELRPVDGIVQALDAYAGTRGSGAARRGTCPAARDHAARDEAGSGAGGAAGSVGMMPALTSRRIRSLAVLRPICPSRNAAISVSGSP